MEMETARKRLVIAALGAGIILIGIWSGFFEALAEAVSRLFWFVLELAALFFVFLLLVCEGN